ncbi:MAG: putative beta-lysine N-acetyltransferase [Desulfococcaceae bacterium]|jgi:putative beta-lysine N-acetyltransferase|nr:putative beta-lysine N-acetyltransferase [Desulfococcaceae bacterium]
MRDCIEKLLHSTIQHGPLNRRVYLMKLKNRDLPDIIPAMERLAQEKDYEKILTKVADSQSPPFMDAGYRQEARIPGFFQGRRDGLFLCKYFTESRKVEKHPVQVRKNWDSIQCKGNSAVKTAPPALFPVTPCTLSDAREMSGFYAKIFPTYPFPLFDPQYIADTMSSHVRYFCIRKKGRIAALAAAEQDKENGNAEMTDFAVSPRWRRQKMATALLREMEKEMRKNGMITAYTIARTLSPGINMTFKKTGYQFGGKLLNNTHIAGGIESMWVWYKDLQAAPE